MEIPRGVSYGAPLAPLGVRLLIAYWYPRASRGLLGGAKRTDEHRALIVALAGFSLAGIAIIATQTNAAFGPSLFDITISFVFFLGALAVQSWKQRWRADLLADGLRDAATTALLLFIVRLSVAASSVMKWPPSHVGLISAAAGVVWILDPVVSIVFTIGYFKRLEASLEKADKR